MTQSKVQTASTKADVLDRETQAILSHVRRSNTKAIRWFIACWTILLFVGIFGIYKQVEIALHNQQHLDCIVKLLGTPQPSGTNHKFITDASQECNIKFN